MMNETKRRSGTHTLHAAARFLMRAAAGVGGCRVRGIAQSEAVKYLLDRRTRSVHVSKQEYVAESSRV